MAISTITSNSIADGAVTSSDLASGAVEQAMTTQIGGRRNLIINGAMQVAQRGDQTGLNNTSYGPDRWRVAGSRSELTWDIEQSSDAPDGFGSSLKITVNTPETTLSASDQFNIQYRMEGQDLQGIKKGTPSAEKLTLSFWVKCSLTGTWTMILDDEDNNRVILKNFTIDSANTWEYKTMTFAEDTTGTFENNNQRSLRLRLYLDAGSDFTSGSVTEDTWQTPSNPNLVEQATGFMTTDAATFQLTGVQLEVGSVASSYEHRSYGEELALCQRYYYNYGSQAFICTFIDGNTTTRVGTMVQFPTTMRAGPSVSYTTPNVGASLTSGTMASHYWSVFNSDSANRGAITYIEQVVLDAEL